MKTRSEGAIWKIERLFENLQRKTLLVGVFFVENTDESVGKSLLTVRWEDD